jgi:hypothetical protein
MGDGTEGTRMTQRDWQGPWRQIHGRMRVAADDLGVMHGRREQLVGRLQECCGYPCDVAERDVVPQLVAGRAK